MTKYAFWSIFDCPVLQLPNLKLKKYVCCNQAQSFYFECECKNYFLWRSYLTLSYHYQHYHSVNPLANFDTKSASVVRTKVNIIINLNLFIHLTLLKKIYTGKNCRKTNENHTKCKLGVKIWRIGVTGMSTLSFYLSIFGASLLFLSSKP